MDKLYEEVGIAWQAIPQEALAESMARRCEAV